MSEKKQNHYIIIWTESELRGSHMLVKTRWRPFHTWLGVQETADTHIAQFGDIVDIVDVNDPENPRSAWAIKDEDPSCKNLH